MILLGASSRGTPCVTEMLGQEHLVSFPLEAHMPSQVILSSSSPPLKSLPEEDPVAPGTNGTRHSLLERGSATVS